ncbi:MAG: endonuclease/exonuclease/phosphatase family protein, partial [Actinomycetota bacterium]|nr:endonuclease/exonuclease/phosphatase family protein [Actinomycetota bacterium]
VGKGLSYDKLRDAETKSLLRQAGALASSHDVPVIYAGDFNSTVNSNHVVDAPAIAMRAARINDAQLAAQTLSNARYNSSNQYVRTPPAFGQSIDYVFAPPGIGVRSRSLIIRQTHGKFVGVMPSDHNPIQAELTFPY